MCCPKMAKQIWYQICLPEREEKKGAEKNMEHECMGKERAQKKIWKKERKKINGGFWIYFCLMIFWNVASGWKIMEQKSMEDCESISV